MEPSHAAKNFVAMLSYRSMELPGLDSFEIRRDGMETGIMTWILRFKDNTRYARYFTVNEIEYMDNGSLADFHIKLALESVERLRGKSIKSSGNRAEAEA